MHLFSKLIKHFPKTIQDSFVGSFCLRKTPRNTHNKGKDPHLFQGGGDFHALQLDESKTLSEQVPQNKMTGSGGIYWFSSWFFSFSVAPSSTGEKKSKQT